LQPFEMSEVDGIFITALVMPLDDGLEKDREKGIRCLGFGGIKEWTISGYNEGTAVIWISTEIADYKCVKPASSYRSYFDHFNEKAQVCVEVYRKLAKSVRGSPWLGLEELLASVVRSINSNRKSGGIMSKDFVISIGEFIYSQLVGLDNTAASNNEILATLPVLVALRDESKSRVEFNKFSALPSSGTLKIKDEQCNVVGEEEDEKLARLLQEEEEWKIMKQRGQYGISKKNVYIKISETEIANDYPLPAYYKSYSQEMDEYMFDSDIGMFSDDMPVRILNNWVLYNSDSRLIPLELIPMKSDAENDTVIFGSGLMRDDGSCCSTAESAHLSSSSSKPCQDDLGIPIYLSPIKEWVIEFGGFISKIWGDYYTTHFPDDTKEDGNEQKEIDEQEENEDDDNEEEVNVEIEQPVRTPPSTRSRKSPSKTCKEVDWKGQTAGKTVSGEVLYKCVIVRGLIIGVGQSVTLEDDSGEAIMFFTEYMYEKHDGPIMAHGRILQKGFQTVLGNAANEREVFLTNDCLEFELGDIKGLVAVNVQSMPWGHKYRKENSEVNRRGRRQRRGRGRVYLWSIFAKAYTGQRKVVSSLSLMLKLALELVPVAPGEGHETYKAGRNVGLKPYVVCHVLSIHAPAGSKKAHPESTKVNVYYSEDIMTVPVEMIEGKCEVRMKDDLPNSDLPVVAEHIFYCKHLFDPVTGALKQLPPNVKLMSLIGRAPSASKKNKGKQICDDEQAGSDKKKDMPSENTLATLDIFAGCGGLSEGLQLAGASQTKWAIEYEEPAGEAFCENHPEAAVFEENCNVILKAIMDKCGDADDCISTSEAAERASKLSDEKIKNLPVPGEVDFINGGPPCQGFSGMNRFNQSPWSKVQCEMILAFLSFAEYFRPRFFLLENCRNFVSFNKGQTIRLTLASLLEMGYQVRFGILEAGVYGVTQSRKRALIWAAAAGETLPEWPEPTFSLALS
ncbi:DNA (cytosine-5)-methyltransferase 1A, partial [Dichanthelium oligosanthes]